MTEDRLTREKHTNWFNASFVWCRSLYWEVKTREVVKPEHVNARFVEEWKVLEKMWEDKRVWTEGSKEWETSQVLSVPKSIVPSDSYCVPPSAEIRMFLSSRCRESTSPVISYDLLRGQWRRSENLSHTHHFSNSCTLKHLLGQVAIFCGSVSRILSDIKVKHYRDHLR